MVKLVDTPDLGSGAFGIRVQVPSLAKVNAGREEGGFEGPPAKDMPAYFGKKNQDISPGKCKKVKKT